MDTLFLTVAGLAVIGASWWYAITGWPCPGLVAK